MEGCPMTAMTFGTLSPETIFNVTEPAQRHVRRGSAAIGFSHTLIGKLLDFLGSSVVSNLSAKLERDVLTLRGLCAWVNDSDGVVVDPSHKATRSLISLERSIRSLRGSATRAQTNPSLRKTREAMTRFVELVGALEKVVMTLKLAITEHDARIAVQLEDVGKLVYELTDRQAEQFEGCITSEKQP